MLDLNYIKENLDKVQQGMKKRGLEFDFKNILRQADERRKIIQEIELLRNKKNQSSKEISSIKKQGKNSSDLVSTMKEIGKNISDKEAVLENINANIHNFLAKIPNVPDEDIVAGGKENNKVIEISGKKPVFDFEPLDHIKLSEKNKMIDYKRGVKLSGRGSWIYSGWGARLEWALLNFFIDEHVKDGYEFVMPPHILNSKCGFGAGQFPKFKDEVFMIDDGSNEEKFLLPTAETALVNIHSDEILSEDSLPLKYFAYSPCYRREIGSYRAEERGMVRGKQFNKVEMFQFVKPGQSDKAFEEILTKSKSLVRKLGLHYRTSKMAAKDIAAGMSRTYDVEVWIPSMSKYKEVSSVSNARDYQARRTMTKYKNEKTKKNEYLHMLNGSGLATSRILPAILEQNQLENGEIRVPDVLVKYLGVEIIDGKKR